MKPETNIRSVSEESGRNKEEEDIPGVGKNFTLKKPLEIFHSVESTKDTMLEAGASL